MKKLIAFDLDGTLLDDMETFWTAVCGVYHWHGVSPPTPEKHFLQLEADGGNWHKTYRALGVETSNENIDYVFRKIFVEEFTEPTLFPDVEKVLAALHGRGHCLAIVTAQQEEIAIDALGKTGIHRFFHFSFYNRTNKASDLICLRKQLATLSEYCYFVSDTPSDIRAGKEAGVNTIAFLNGFVPEKCMFRARADFYIHKLLDIATIVG